MKARNIEYEKKFRSYLFSGCFERHKEICKNINIKPNITKKIDKDFSDDKEKIKDFKKLSKEEFLKSYSYLTEEEYNLTTKRLNKKVVNK